MTYTSLLNKLIDSSGLQLIEIAERCNQYGEKITPSYVSVLKNTEGRIPSDSVSYALAKACNSKYENILVVQAYIDAAPNPIINILNGIKESTFSNSLKVMSNEFSDQEVQEIQEAGKAMSLAEFICLSGTTDITQVNIEDILSDSIYTRNITVKDDSMSPLITKGSQIITSPTNDLKNGDIVYYENAVSKEKKIRLFSVIDDQRSAFIPFSRGYKTEILTTSDYNVLSTVTRVVKKL